MVARDVPRVWPHSNLIGPRSCGYRGRGASAGRHHPRAPVPREASWVNVASLRMDKQRGRPVLIEFFDFCRVPSLRTLPYVRAWHERYADGGPARRLGPRSRLRARRATRTPCAAPSRGWGSSIRCCSTTSFELWARLRQRGLAGALPLWADEPATSCATSTTARAPTRETERAIQELLGVEREPLAPVRPEDDPERADRRPDARRRGRVLGAVRGGRRVGGALGRRGRRARTGARSRSTHPGAYPLVEHPRHTPACSSSRSATASTCHAVCVHAGRRSLAPEGRQSPRTLRTAAARRRSTSTSAARPVRAAAARRRRGRRCSWTHEPVFMQRRAAARRPLRGVVAVSGPVRWVWPKRPRRRRRRAAADRLAHREQPRAAQLGARQVGARPGPGRRG